jgi:hypothetical protein
MSTFPTPASKKPVQVSSSAMSATRVPSDDEKPATVSTSFPLGAAMMLLATETKVVRSFDVTDFDVAMYGRSTCRTCPKISHCPTHFLTCRARHSAMNLHHSPLQLPFSASRIPGRTLSCHPQPAHLKPRGCRAVALAKKKETNDEPDVIERAVAFLFGNKALSDP